MFKKLVVLTFLLLLSRPAMAQMPYVEEMQALGTVAGQGLVCGAAQYDKFEMLARAIMLTKAPNNDLLQKGVYAYTEAKANTYLAKKMDAGYLCDEISERFNSQDIFKITLYEDGTLKMPDGSILTPKMPYDANKIYKKDDNLRANLKAIYEGSTNKARNKALKQGLKVSSSSPTNPPPVVKATPSKRAPVSRKGAPTSAPIDAGIGHISRR